MTWEIQGKLKSSDAASAALARCRVDVFFELIDPVATPETGMAEATIQGSASARTDETGQFVVRIPDKTQLVRKTPIHFVISTPSGETIGEIWKEPNQVETPETFQVLGFKPISLERPKDPPLPQPRRATGKVIDRQARHLPPNLQVLLYARLPGDKKKKTIGEDAPVFVAPVDKSGYFSGDVPNEEFESAAAVVTGIPGEITVGLEDGLIPRHIPLVVDLPESLPAAGKKADCGCEGASSPPRSPSQDDLVNSPETYSVDLGTGGCVQFNTPNRAIEEFDFYTVVRTTEPAVRVVTRGETRPVTSEGSGASETIDLATLEETEERLKAEATAKRAIAKAKSNLAAAAEKSAAEAWTKADRYSSLASSAQKAYDDAVRERDKYAQGSTEWQQANRQVILLSDHLDEKKQAAAIATAEADAASKAASSARSAADSANADAARAETDAANAAAAVAAERARLARIEDRKEAGSTRKPPGRVILDTLNLVDWDETPTFYEATEIAHGHLLHFKQVWYADGYSLGDLLYSLPLAPGQKKLISVIDWERRERTERTEATFSGEALVAALSRDRDLSEVVTGALTESSQGGSKNITAGMGIGTGAAGSGTYQGFNFGGLLGVSGGIGGSQSTAWQDSARSLSSFSLQSLRDKTLQSASAIRGLRSSVVHAVAQGEAVRATTEVIANHNHCHALTIQYFEVLRHLKVTHELADVQECLFVPLPMSEFDRAKALRWRQALQIYLQRRDLIAGFDSARRVETGWSEVYYPPDRYADEKIASLTGELQLTVIIPLPPFPERPLPNPEDPIGTAEAVTKAANPTTGYLGVMLAVATGGASLIAGAATEAASNAAKVATQGARNLADELYALTPQERYDKFQHDVMPGAVAGFVDQLQLWALIDTEVQVSNADFTLVSEYQPGVPLLVSMRCTLTSQYSRADFKQLIIKSKYGLPNGSRAIINSATVRYRTSSFEHALVDDRRVNDDIDMPKVVPVFTDSELSIQQLANGRGATLYTPIDAWEQRNPRKEDERLSAELIDHLNDNLEFYHHAIWWTMDPNRRYLLLDGIVVEEAKNRSVASVVENRLIGIVGNSLVLPVTHGNHLDPCFGPNEHGKYANLLDHYALASPVPPARVSLPTRGVFAEAVMGYCNACEQIDDSRFWRWEESPIDEPPAIEPTSTATRRTQPDSGQPIAFPTPIVSIQNAPSVPDPTGVRAALELLGKQSFADITGLAGTQANAAAAYSRAMDTALQFGKEASTLAQQASMTKSIDRTMNAIDKAEAGNKIESSKAKDLRMSALRKLVGDTGETSPDENDVAKRLEVISNAVKSGSISEEDGQDLSRSVLKGLYDGASAEGADAMSDLARRVDPKAIESLKMGTPDGSYGEIVQAVYNPDELGTDKPTPASKTGMSGLADEEGNTSPLVKRALDGCKEWIDAIGEGIANWKDSPNKDLSGALADALYEAASEAAQNATDEIPILKAIRLTAKYSLEFAKGLGEELDKVNQTLSRKYRDAIDSDPGINGYTDDDIRALRYCLSYQLNAVNELPAILLAGVDKVVEKGIGDMYDWAAGTVAKKFLGVTKSLLTHLIGKSPLRALISNLVDLAAEDIPQKRQQIYRAVISSTISLYVRQLDDPALRSKLSGLTKLGGKEPLDKAILTALASILVDSAFQDPKLAEFVGGLNKESRTWLVQRMSQLVTSLNAKGVQVISTNAGAPKVSGNTVELPSKLLTEIQKGEEAADEDQYQKWLNSSRILDPIREATERRLSLLTRVRRPHFVYLYKYGKAEDLPKAHSEYWDQCKLECDRVRELYWQVYNRVWPSWPMRNIIFEWIDMVDLYEPYRMYYDIEKGELAVQVPIR